MLTPSSGPMRTYHTLHQLQSLAAAEFAALAQQAQVYQAQQQALITYQQQLWNAQRQVQMELQRSINQQMTRVAADAGMDVTTLSLPLSLPQPMTHTTVDRCWLCVNDPDPGNPSTLPSSAAFSFCTLSCTHSFHQWCLSHFILHQQNAWDRRQDVDAEADADATDP